MKVKHSIDKKTRWDMLCTTTVIVESCTVLVPTAVIPLSLELSGRDFDRPYMIELALSSLELTKACPTSLAVLVSRMGRMWRRSRMWYWQDWHIRHTCLLKASDESMLTPSSLILSDVGMGEPLTSPWVMLSFDLSRVRVPRRMASDFSGFKHDHYKRTRKKVYECSFKATYPFRGVAFW